MADWNRIQKFIDGIPEKLDSESWDRLLKEAEALGEEDARYAVEHLMLRKPA